MKIIMQAFIITLKNISDTFQKRSFLHTLRIEVLHNYNRHNSLPLNKLHINTCIQFLLKAFPKNQLFVDRHMVD